MNRRVWREQWYTKARVPWYVSLIDVDMLLCEQKAPVQPGVEGYVWVLCQWHSAGVGLHTPGLCVAHPGLTTYRPGFWTSCSPETTLLQGCT